MAGGSENEPSLTSDDDVADGLGITMGATRHVARRQLIGSIVMLILVAAIAIIVGLRGSQSTAPVNAGRSGWAVRSPTYAVLKEHVVAEKQGRLFERSLSTR